jgi:hypothetical protein
MENTYKIGPENKKRSFFSLLEETVRLDRWFSAGIPVELFPKVLFTTALVILYIGLTHSNENKIRNINKLEKQVEDLRADYTTLKADYMFSSKQSEVAKAVEGLGLKETVEPPNKIVVREGEY